MLKSRLMVVFHSSVNCAEPTYTTSAHRFSLYNGIVNHIPLEKVNNTILIYLFYQSTDVKNSQQIPIMTFWGFISATGGSLGLFLGFSCLSSVWTLFDMFEKKVLNGNSETKTKTIKLKPIASYESKNDKDPPTPLSLSLNSTRQLKVESN